MRSVAITSGKGGTGKTAVAVSLSIALSQAGRRVLLFDGDLGLANIDIQLGITVPFNLSHVVEGEKKLAEILVAGPSGVQVLPGASGIVEMERLSAGAYGQLFDGLAALEQSFDVLVIDTGAGIADSVQILSAAADDVVIVMTPDPSALVDAYALAKVLAGRCSHSVLRVIVNQVTGKGEAGTVFERLRAVVSKFLPTQLELLGSVQLDRAMADAVRNRQPLLSTSTHSPAAADLRDIAGRLASLPSATHARGGFWERMLDSSRRARP